MSTELTPKTISPPCTWNDKQLHCNSNASNPIVSFFKKILIPTTAGGALFLVDKRTCVHTSRGFQEGPKTLYMTLRSQWICLLFIISFFYLRRDPPSRQRMCNNRRVVELWRYLSKQLNRNFLIYIVNIFLFMYNI